MRLALIADANMSRLGVVVRLLSGGQTSLGHDNPADYGTHQNMRQGHGLESSPAQGAGRSSNLNNHIYSARGGGNGGPNNMPKVPGQRTDLEMSPQRVSNILHGLGILDV